jgi:hypothetical protein
VRDAHLAPVDREDLGGSFSATRRSYTIVVADTKQDVLDMLRELAELTQLDEADPQSFACAPTRAPRRRSPRRRPISAG